jgi:tight adherence protein B
MTPVFLFATAIGTILLLLIAFSQPSGAKAQSRRLKSVKSRHSNSGATVVETQMRRILAARETKLEGYFTQLIPNPALLRKRIEMTGKDWTLSHYGVAALIITTVTAVLMLLQGLPIILALLAGIAAGLGLPHMVIGSMIKRRITKFTSKFPDAIELLVRGLRSGRTMEAALQETADRLGTPEFQFFVITLAIQRETGGNLAETLSNLADVLRKRAQMKLKISAMSSESKASAYIIGSLPFGVFGIIMFLNPRYMGTFFVDERLIIAGLGGLVWMGIGAFIMRQMINFEI